jgi:hypothetical protein
MGIKVYDHLKNEGVEHKKAFPTPVGMSFIPTQSVLLCFSINFQLIQSVV